MCVIQSDDIADNFCMIVITKSVTQFHVITFTLSNETDFKIGGKQDVQT